MPKVLLQLHLPAALLCACLLASLSLARADEPDGYADAIEGGIAEFSEKNFEEARARFLKAHALYPNARTLRALGMVEYELKNYVDSVRYLEHALSSAERPLDADMRAAVEKLLEAGNGYVARYTLRVDSETHVLLDGSEPDAGSSELVLPIGKHLLEFHAPGRIGQRRELNVKGGERERISVTLAPLAPGDDVAHTESVNRRDKRPVYKNPWLWSAVGVVVLGATAGALIATYGRDDAKTAAPLANSDGTAALMPPP